MSASQQILFGISGGFNATLTIASDTLNYNIYSQAIGAGWDGVLPINLTINVNSGVYVGSSSISTAAMYNSGAFPTGSKITINNSGYIVGRGGDGNSGNGSGALFINNPGVSVFVNNTGTIGGGGGGGSVGTGYYPGNGFNAGGGGGGGGQGYAGGNGGAYNPSANPAGWPYSNGAYGTNGTKTGAGSGGGGGYTTLGYAPKTNVPSYGYGGTGAVGGTLGNNGGSAGNSGGAAGYAVSGNPYITWISTGTRLGAIY